MLHNPRFQIRIFDWPDRFYVEDAHYKDYHHFPFDDLQQSKTDPAEFLVDLSEFTEGRCDCGNFRCNVEPTMKNKNGIWKSDYGQSICEHIVVARSYRFAFTEKPKTLQPLLIK